MQTKNKTVFAQILSLIPSELILEAVEKYNSDRYSKTYNTYTQLITLLFGQLNDCTSLRELEYGLDSFGEPSANLGLKRPPARSTMADNHERRDYRVFEHIFKGLVNAYSGMFSRTAFYKTVKQLDGKQVYIADSTTIDLCLNLFRWAEYRVTKGAVKVHTLLDATTQMPVVVNITKGSVSDISGSRTIPVPDNSVVMEDRGYYSFKRYKDYVERGVTFISRFKKNTIFEALRGAKVGEKATKMGVIWDEVGLFTGKQAEKQEFNDHPIRQILVRDPETENQYKLLTNNLDWPAELIVQLYRRRWDIELFFKALKQNFRVKSFVGTSKNAVKSQIYVALIAFILLEFIRKNVSKQKHSFKHLVTFIRICLISKVSLRFLVNELKKKRAEAQFYGPRNDPTLFD